MPRPLLFPGIGLAVVFVWLGLPTPAQAYIDGPYGLGSMVYYSSNIFVMQVEKVSTEKRVVIYKKVADLKGKYPEERFQHHINDGSRVVMEWAEPGKIALCFMAPDLNHPVLTAIDHYWYLCSNTQVKGWLRGDGMPFLCWAYFGTADKLQEHVKAIMAKKEVVITAVQHGGEGISRWSDYTSREQARKYPVWRIKASLEKNNRPTDKKTDLLVALGAGGAESVPGLVEALKGNDPAARMRAANELGQIGAEAKPALPALYALLKEDNPLVRVSAAEALVLIDPANQPALRALAELLKSDDARVRLTAAEGLGKVGPGAKAAVPALIDRLKDERPGVRRSAAWALSQIGPDAKPALPALTETLKDKDVTVRRAAGWGLVHLDPANEGAILVIAEAMKDPDWMYRREAVNTLAGLGPRAKPAATALAEALLNPTTQYGAVGVLKQLGPDAKAAVPFLIGLVKDQPHSDTRWWVIEILGEIGPAAKDAIPALTQAVQRANDPPEVRKAAALSLKKVQGKE